jgi:peptidoglycan-associated lipoprotein
VFQIEFSFATNETILTTASRETLRAQAAWLRKKF